MSAAAVQDYRALIAKLLAAREAAGGTLPDDAESAYVADLDRLWWLMLPLDQAAIEAEFAVPTAGKVDPSGGSVTVTSDEQPPP